MSKKKDVAAPVAPAPVSKKGTVAVSDNYKVQDGDKLVVVTCDDKQVVVALPAPSAAHADRKVVVEKADDTGEVVVSGATNEGASVLVTAKSATVTATCKQTVWEVEVSAS